MTDCMTTIEVITPKGKVRSFDVSVERESADLWAEALAAEWNAESYRIDGGDEVCPSTVDFPGHTPGVPAEDCEVCGPLLAEDGEAE